MSDSARSHRWQPTRLPCPWDSPGKNTGVGCHFLLQCVKVESEVAQSCPALRNPMDCTLPGSSNHGIFQAKVLERVAIAFSHMHIVEPEVLAAQTTRRCTHPNIRATCSGFSEDADILSGIKHSVHLQG